MVGSGQLVSIDLMHPSVTVREGRETWMLVVATAGWSIPKRFTGECPPGNSHLARYSQVLSGVEINSSFKQWHQRKTYARWADATPDNFRFSVKLPHTITHEAKLIKCEALLDLFAEGVAGLGQKLDAVLIQLPPAASFRPNIAQAFFTALSERVSAKLVLEPRHEAWFEEEANALLTSRRIARVAADPAICSAAGVPGGWSGSSYYRLHGSPKTYYSSYDVETLSSLYRQINLAEEAWVVFDNTATGAAFGNALEFVRLHGEG